MGNQVLALHGHEAWRRWSGRWSPTIPCPVEVQLVGGSDRLVVVVGESEVVAFEQRPGELEAWAPAAPWSELDEAAHEAVERDP